MRHDEHIPHSEFVRDKMEPDYYLTHVIWHNSYGSYQPETGVRKVENGKPVKDSFRLIEHGCPDFNFAEPIILKSLRKGRDNVEIGRLVEWLHKRQRRAAIRGFTPPLTAEVLHDSAREMHLCRKERESTVITPTGE